MVQKKKMTGSCMVEGALVEGDMIKGLSCKKKTDMSNLIQAKHGEVSKRRMRMHKPDVSRRVLQLFNRYG